MPARGLHGLWLRGVAAAAACLLALASSGALVAAAVVSPTGHSSGAVLTDSHSQSGENGDGNASAGAHGHGNGGAKGKGNGGAGKPTPAKPPKPTHAANDPATTMLKPPTHPKGAARPASTGRSTAEAAAPAAAAPTARVVVDTTDAAPFSAQSVAATEATRVLPVEALGPLSGISFGSGLFVWPLLLAVDVLALAVIARMALRRRLASPED